MIQVYPTLCSPTTNTDQRSTFVCRRNSADELPQTGNDTRFESTAQYTEAKRERSQRGGKRNQPGRNCREVEEQPDRGLDVEVRVSNATLNEQSQ